MRRSAAETEAPSSAAERLDFLDAAKLVCRPAWGSPAAEWVSKRERVETEQLAAGS